jgi:glycerate 2-kinase
VTGGAGARLTVLCCPDKFRGTASAADAARWLATGARVAGAEAIELPLADGGEGTVEVALTAGGELVEVEATDALGRAARGRVGMLPGGTAIVEVAEAIGLARLDAAERDVMRASSYGAGQLIRAALDAGAQRIVLAVGGSATVDGGLGMLRALGARVVADDGSALGGSGADLDRLARVDATGLDPRLSGRVEIACDVNNPLAGPAGAAPVFGPQKGATPEQVERLDRGLARLGEILGLEAGSPGLGAAGGIAAPLVALAGARLRSGAELVQELAGFEAAVAGADLCLTGEGKVDGQSARGKTVAAVARTAARHGVPVVVVAGAVEPEAADLYAAGVTAVFGIARGARTLDDAAVTAQDDLRWAGESVTRLFAAAPQAMRRPVSSVE